MHFRRQAPVGRYFPDFVCHRSKLIVELDGSQHADGAAIAYDAKRTGYLNSRGYRVLRFWNCDVPENRDGVSEIIAATQRPPSPPTAGDPATCAGRAQVQ
jgi:very-short-patch-repair endonuclease